MGKCSNRSKITGKKRKADVVQEDSPVDEGEEEIVKAHQDTRKQRRGVHQINMRCEPNAICEAVQLLNAPQREKLKELGFGCLLDFKMTRNGSRDLIVWLMDHLDPNTMVLDFGGSRKLEITEHAVWCVLGLPSGDLDAPSLPCKLSLHPLRQKLCVPKRKKYIEWAYVKEKIKSGGTDKFTMQCFMMIVLSKLLVCGSDFYVTPTIWSMVQDIERFGNMDWCKFTVNHLRHSASKWKKPGSKRKTVLGCSAFLVMYYLDNLNVKEDMNPVDTPRVKLFEERKIKLLENADKLQGADGSPVLGNLTLRSQMRTCYHKTTKRSTHVPTNMPVPAQQRRHDSQQTSSEFAAVQINSAPAQVQKEPPIVPDASDEHGRGVRDDGAEAEAVQQQQAADNLSVALVAVEKRNSELQQQVRELTDKLRNTEEALEEARALTRGIQAAINSLTLRVSAMLVGLGDTRPVPPLDVANGSPEQAVKLLKDQVSLIEPVVRHHGTALAKNSVAFGAAALLCREGKGTEALRDAVARDTRRFLREQGAEFGLLVGRLVESVEQQHANAPQLQGGRATGN